MSPKADPTTTSTTQLPLPSPHKKKLNLPSGCDTPDALKLQISDFNAPSSDPDPEPSHQPTGEYLLSLTGPFHGSVTLLQPDRMGPYRQQYLDLRLYAADDAGPDGVLGNATFVPGAEVRNWDGVKWGSVEKGLYPDGGLEATGVVDGVAGTTVTRKAGDGLFLEWVSVLFFLSLPFCGGGDGGVEE